MNINIDSAIFIGFLTINLILGLWTSRGIKNIREYAVGDRNFSTATIAATIIATWISGDYFFTIASEAVNSGLYFIWGATLSDLVCFLLIAYFFAPRMGEFLGKLSIAEAMGSLYGERVRMITALAGVIGIAGIISMQLKVAGMAFEYALGVQSYYGAAIAGILITAYSTLGGIKSVTFTDIIQFITFGIVIPAILYFLLSSIQNINAVSFLLNENPLFDYKKVFDFSNSKSLYFLFFFFFNAIPGFSPAMFQRITMARSTQQVTKSFSISAFTCFTLGIIISWIGILTVAIHPNINPNDVVKTLIIDLEPIQGLKGFILVGILAMIMSTVDSYINSTSVIVVHDFLKPLKFKIFNNELLLARIVSVVIGFAAIILSLRENSLLGLLISTYSFYMPIVTVPFIMAILGFRSTGKSVILGMTAGLITVIIWQYNDITIFDSIIPAMGANLIFLISSHYLLQQNGGWIGIKDDSPLIEIRIKRKLYIKNFLHTLKTFNIINTCNKNSPQSEGLLSILGLFVMISAFSSTHTLPKEFQLQYAYLLNVLYPITLCSSSALISYPLWLPRWKKTNLINICWNFTMFSVLICFSFLMVLISNFSEIQLMVFMINIIVLSSLTTWRWALFIITTGITITAFCYQKYLYLEPQKDLYLSQFKIVYLLLLLIGTLIAFLKPKQEYIEATEHKVDELETEAEHLIGEVTGLNDQVIGLNTEVIGLNSKVIDLKDQVTHYTERVTDQQKEIDRLGATAQKILNNVNHELRLPIGNVVNFSDMLNETLEKSDNKLIKELSKEVYDNSNRVSTMILNMLDLATLEVKKVDLQKTKINFSELVADRIKICHKIYMRDKKIDFELTIESEIMISLDPNYMRQTVDNLVINAISFSNSGLIKVTVAREKGRVVFTITDQGKGIPPKELSDIFTPFKMGSNTESKACGRGVGLALCKSAVEAHGGSITAESNGEIGAKLMFTLPLENIN